MNNDFADRPSIVNARQRYIALDSLISELSSKVSAVATSCENEFLSAYRVHMLAIQAELKDLNEQVNKAEEQLNDDGQVAKLEHEVSWFREESERLRVNSESMRKDLDGNILLLLS
jgi:predicted  nucleic acid-binding Zn-ribbon protein